MRVMPRVAVGTIQPRAEREPIVWALLAALHGAGRDVAQLHSASCLAPHDAARSLTSSGSRHLDSWAMSRTACLRAMYRTCDQAEVAIVEGEFLPLNRAADPLDAPIGSNLATLCDWLDLPRMAIVDVQQLDGCRLPARPQRLDGLLLDRAIDGRHAAHWQTTLEVLWKT